MLFIAGLGILLYPYIQGAMVDRQISMNAQAFLEDKDTQTQSHAVIVPDSTEGTEPEVAVPDKYPELYLAMQNYNTQIWEEKQSGLCDPWSYEQPSFDLTEYGISDEVFGVISIPSLQLEMPIFLGATSKHMADGAAHLSQTSLPVGGNNTNCVIAGHRGYNGASYLSANDYSAYLPNIVISTMKGTLGSMERRMANLLFKVAVELAMVQNLLAANQKIQRSTLDSLRGMCVREVKSLNGTLKLDDAVMLRDD